MISLKQAVVEVGDLIEEAKSKHGELFSYSKGPNGKCFYSPGGDNPYGCIVGFWLREKHGAGLESLSELDEGNHSAYTATLKLGIDVDESAAVFLDVLQARQDRGLCWAEAFQGSVEYWQKRWRL